LAQAKSESAHDHHRDHLFSDLVPVRPEPFLVQGEAESTRLDIAARVSGRLRKSPSLAARTLPRALSRSSSIILGWSPSVIAAKGEYAGWRATPATGDFDLHTFAVRGYPVDRSTGCGRGSASILKRAGSKRFYPLDN
jgi:hypothetical protein